jgi:hypothetical protein
VDWDLDLTWHPVARSRRKAAEKKIISQGEPSLLFPGQWFCLFPGPAVRRAFHPTFSLVWRIYVVGSMHANGSLSGGAALGADDV